MSIFLDTGTLNKCKGKMLGHSKRSRKSLRPFEFKLCLHILKIFKCLFVQKKKMGFQISKIKRWFLPFLLVLTPLIFSLTNFDFIKINYDLVVPMFFILTSLLLISKFPSYSFKKIVIQRKTTIFLLFGIVLFFGLLLIYPFNVIAISAIVYLGILPISYFHYQKLKKQNEDINVKDDDDDLEDIL